MNDETFLQLHNRLLSAPIIGWVSEGYNEPKLQRSGLCGIDFNGNPLGHHPLIQGYFGLSEMPILSHRGKYIPIRQNIILFCAAINGEL